MKRIGLVVWLMITVFGHARELLSSLPFKFGERLSFRIYILGQYVGNHFMRIEGRTNIDGTLYPIVHGRTATREDLKHLYDMDDKDWTIFDTKTLLPLYNERQVKEGKWIDHLRQEFVPSENACYYYHKTRNYQKDVLKARQPIMDYNTLMLYFRGLDYNRIYPTDEILVSYKHRDTIYQSSFTYKRVEVTYKKQKVSAIQLREKDGLGIYFTILDDETRTPYEIRIAAFYIVGFRFVDLRVVIENYQSGVVAL